MTSPITANPVVEPFKTKNGDRELEEQLNRAFETLRTSRNYSAGIESQGDLATQDTVDWDTDVDSIPTGIVQIFYQATAPASGMNVGDYWKDSDDDLLYRWNGSAWVEVQDDEIDTAIADAASAQATADGKVVVFAQTTAPTAEGIGDVWLDTDDDNHLYWWSGSSWTDYAQLEAAWDQIISIPGSLFQIFYQSAAPSSGQNEGDYWVDSDDNLVYKYISSVWTEIQDDDIASAIADAATAQAAADAAQATADGKIVTFYQASAPSGVGESVGDLWVDSDNNLLYRYNGSVWNEVQDDDIATAIADAATAQSAADAAQATADGKIVTFYQATAPSGSGEAVGDLWVDSDNNLLYRYNGSAWVEVQDDDIATAIADAATAQSAADAAQATADGKIVTFYQATAPSGAGEASGDLWVDSDTDILYRYSGSAWVEVQDDDITTAISNAATAQTTADGKTKVFYQSGAPTAEETGDFWKDSDDDQFYRWNGSTWIAVQDNEIDANVAAAADAQSTADSKTVIFFQATAPSSGHQAGDFWKDTDDNMFYRYSGSTWVEVQDDDIATSLSDAATAQSTADSKTVIFYQTTAPISGHQTGDFWKDTDDNMFYRYTGSVWTEVQDDDIATSLSNAATAQSTADSKTVIFYQTTAPTSGQQTGDFWKDTDDNMFYRYNGSTWTEVQDDDIATSLSDAANAQSTADSKTVVFYQATAPSSGYQTGDFWKDSDDDLLYRYNGSTWVVVQDDEIDQAIADAAAAQSTADNKTIVFYQSSAPSSGHQTGDLWIDSDDHMVYRYTGAAWVEVQDDDIALAINNAATAQSTADGKIYVYAQTTAPGSPDDVGDLWIDTDDNNHMYRWSGAAWVDYEQYYALWSLVALTANAPDDNATVGATWNSDINNQPADADITNSNMYPSNQAELEGLPNSCNVGTGTTTQGFRLDSDGAIYATTVSSGVYTDQSDNWLLGGNNSDYECFVTKVNGLPLTSGTTGSWLGLGVDRTFYRTSSTGIGTFQVMIRNATTKQVLAVSTIDLDNVTV